MVDRPEIHFKESGEGKHKLFSYVADSGIRFREHSDISQIHYRRMNTIAEGISLPNIIWRITNR
jgi:hypothetical protein